MLGPIRAVVAVRDQHNERVVPEDPWNCGFAIVGQVLVVREFEPFVRWPAFSSMNRSGMPFTKLTRSARFRVSFRRRSSTWDASKKSGLLAGNVPVYQACTISTFSSPSSVSTGLDVDLDTISKSVYGLICSWPTRDSSHCGPLFSLRRAVKSIASTLHAGIQAFDGGTETVRQYHVRSGFPPKRR